jgi:hypothetical protein
LGQILDYRERQFLQLANCTDEIPSKELDEPRQVDIQDIRQNKNIF